MRTPRLDEKEFLAGVLRPFHDAIVKALAPHFHDVFEGEDPADDPELIHYAIDLIHDAGRPFGTFIDDDLIATAIHEVYCDGAAAALRHVERASEIARQRSGQDANMYSPRNAAYDVAKLVGKTLVRRIERSRRYAVDPPGVRALRAYLLLREKVIKPLLAGVVRPCRRPPKVSAPLDHHYVALRQELHRTFETIGLAVA